MRSTTRPLLALALLTLIWGYNWVIMKSALVDAPPLYFAAFRVLGGVIVLFGVGIATKRPLKAPTWRYVIPLGLLQTTGFVGFALWALQFGGAGQTAMLVYMMPLWLIILAWPLLGERVHGLQWPALTLALVGLVFILKPWHTQPHTLGTLLALLSGVFWAASAVWQKRAAPPQTDIIAVTAWQTAVGGLALILLAFWLEPLRIHWTPLFIGALLYNAIPGSAIALLLWAYAVDRLPPGMAGMATLFSPLIGVLAAWLQLGERPGLFEGMGMTAIFLALALVTWQHLHSHDVEFSPARPQTPR
ncbi:DMT family transporter [Sulfobacillus sp. hq2]|uniref:DMT family transporter n=1 Tax=Sulfobacillus sp. hq2 TaxID=2039167 RepID=UPI000CD12C45|nr:EamA family transporter [Sulfobacillus sp. hq2]POB10030.1 EamA family transporter [Sulfobacillus sp. hq2]